MYYFLGNVFEEQIKTIEDQWNIEKNQTKIDCRIFSKRTRENELKINQIKLKNWMKKLIEMV